MTRPTGSSFNRPGGDDERFVNLSPRDVANIHVTSDKDSRAEAIHHTLGPAGYQASPGDHAHDGITSAQIPIANLPVAQLIPTGTVWAWAGPYTTVPDGWLICDGRELSRTDPLYKNLYAAIGIAHGSLAAGTFSIPDCRGRSIYGYTGANPNFTPLGKTGGSETMAHTHNSAAHSHALGDTGWAQITMNAGNPGFLIRRVAATAWAAALQFATPAPPTGGGGNQTLGAALDGNTGSTTPGATGAASNANALSPYITMNFMIKL